MDDYWIEDVGGLKTLLRKKLERYSKEISKYLDYYAKQNLCDTELFNFKIKSPITKKQVTLNIFNFQERIDSFFFKLCCTQAVWKIMKEKIDEDRKFCKKERGNLFKVKHSYQFFANAEYLFYNLSSSLDSLSHILNESYGLEVARNEVDFNKIIEQLHKLKSTNNRILKYFQKYETEYREYNKIRNYIAHHSLLPSKTKVNPDLSFEPHHIKLNPLTDEGNLNAKSEEIEKVSSEYLNFCIDMFLLLAQELEENIVPCNSILIPKK